jgi:glutaredoxin
MNSLLTASSMTQKSGWVAVALCAAGLAIGSAEAQGVYRIVGPDGRVTYSDQPPANNAEAAAVGSSTLPSAASGNAQLPLALRQIVNRYPVILYTGNNCSPCNTGRNLLTGRGIPFSEKTVSSAEDIEAFKRLTGDLSLPLLSIGTQRLKGFSDNEWTQYLTAAGYPTQSTLPANYQRPAPAALVEVKAAATAPKEAAKEPRRDTTAETPVVPTTTNPAGIRF